MGSYMAFDLFQWAHNMKQVSVRVCVCMCACVCVYVCLLHTQMHKSICAKCEGCDEVATEDILLFSWHLYLKPFINSVYRFLSPGKTSH